ncbi:hypothetical protein YPPY92_2258, partial [Yersinia pestis PY-92]
MPGD